MASKNVSFSAVKTIKKPTRLQFMTKSGQEVSFRAIRTIEKKTKIPRF